MTTPTAAAVLFALHTTVLVEAAGQMGEHEQITCSGLLYHFDLLRLLLAEDRLPEPANAGGDVVTEAGIDAAEAALVDLDAAAVPALADLIEEEIRRRYPAPTDPALAMAF